MCAREIGFFVNYGASVHMASTRAQYRLIQAIPLIPTGIAFGLSWLCPETPRYLVSKQQHQVGLEVLARLRGKSIDDDSLLAEFKEIDTQARDQANLATTSRWAALKETQTNSNYRQRFWLIMTMQTIAQWTGGNGITYYVSDIFEVCHQPTSCFLKTITLIVQIVCWYQEQFSLPGLFRCIRDSQAFLYIGLHLGLDRLLRPTTLRAYWLGFAASSTYLYGGIHGPATRLRQ